MSTDSLWKTCKTCEKKIAVSAKTCPSCGANNRRLGWLKWVGVTFIILVVTANLVDKDEGAETETKPIELAEKEESVASSTSKSTLPDSQSDFINIVENYSTQFSGAKNELQESIMRDERRNSILDVLQSGFSVANWQGTVSRLETNMDGKAILTIKVSPNVSLTTWNNAFSDILDNTLIEKNSPSYTALLELAIGDTVLVTGSFLSSDDDGVKETSITTAGSMQEPEFLFKFNKISKK